MMFDNQRDILRTKLETNITWLEYEMIYKGVLQYQQKDFRKLFKKTKSYYIKSILPLEAEPEEGGLSLGDSQDQKKQEEKEEGEKSLKKPSMTSVQIGRTLQEIFKLVGVLLNAKHGDIMEVRGKTKEEEEQWKKSLK